MIGVGVQNVVEYASRGCELTIIANTINSETRHKTLEEIAAAFGDKVVEVGEREVEAEGSVLEEKAGARHVEKMEKV